MEENMKIKRRKKYIRKVKNKNGDFVVLALLNFVLITLTPQMLESCMVSKK